MIQEQEKLDNALVVILGDNDIDLANQAILNVLTKED